MKYLFALLLVTSHASALQYSGELGLENRYFLNKGLYQNPQQGDSSLVIRPEFSHSWDQDRKVVTFIPYARLSQLDDEKTHGDLRELSFVGSWEKVELRAGVSKVFWGMVESFHLVDVINQVDAVENIDLEDRLGQPMINPTYVSDFGNFSYFFMPLFRERTFPGPDGRLRNALVIDTDRPVYTHEDAEKHIDHAFRWGHYWGGLEWALGYFKGTDREPKFTVDTVTGQPVPVYVQTEQSSAEIQFVYEDLIIKNETLYKDSETEKAYLSAVTGFEYTFSNKFGGMDIGVLYEWIYDERGNASTIGLSNASFFGARLAVNDENSTELLAGGIVHNDTGDLASFRIESNRRINENWKWEFEANFFMKSPPGTLFDSLRADDYAQLTFSFFY